MSYQVAHASRNVLIPVALAGSDGRSRFNGPLLATDSPGAMAVFFTGEGPSAQEHYTLRVRNDPERPYAGDAWELRSKSMPGGLRAYYLGIPDPCFTGDGGRAPAWRSLSVQIVGAPLLNAGRGYAGGVDIQLQPRVAFPLVPGFLNLAERFFPTLLPWNFIERYSIGRFHPAKGREQLLLRADLQIDPFDRAPISMEKLWEPKNWANAVVENLVPGSEAFFIVQGGCFFTRNRRTTHWFGGSIGLAEQSFRSRAARTVADMGPSRHGAWVFWLEPREDDGEAAALPPGEPRPRHDQAPHLGIRHPMLARIWNFHRAQTLAEGGVPSEASLGDLPMHEAVEALGEVADILLRHQSVLHLVRRATRGGWSAVAHPLLLGSEASAGAVGHRELETAVESLNARKGETLQALEAIFDQSCGYFSWDIIGNPVLESLANYLASRTGVLTAA